MHLKNLHRSNYNFIELTNTNPALAKYVFVNDYNQESIDFSDPHAVIELNRALLKHFYNVQDWTIPEGYLCPPIPGRVDYLLHIQDLIFNDTTKTIKGLDIGVGANCIYPILATQQLGWNMVGSDIDETAVKFAKQNALQFKEKIEIRHQYSNADIFKGVLHFNEFFDFTMCNPPFHASEKEATLGTLKKLNNLQNNPAFKLNFGGQANELWCNGGEALFIKRMIKQSILFKKQVGWFTCLVSKRNHLSKIYKQLEKLNVTYKTVDMTQGNKKSRFIAWKFTD
ncbi:23S rRNA (adenine(1618)-N(6))-methyltransferase RlmF [Cellulophaga tyrosinoxydans]|uniref:Ribosomal RNA large subunit methyltransferase F n=1 Tax=Cellulophaga tyrosinoxydans TaxID=504486 RepID=A0A1W2BKZ6_9FLAO|nr:23S rRNA (adenine(1618)-N(6))-methyltransferase RlmF [Cellulophaga tyrosinoxydans]SMC73332.1 23S rRNA (adenine1618-N6)-methyltransferase [Cellulophaga tyrosinoxydans]